MSVPIVTAAVRNFFFSAFKRGKPFRHAEKEIGTINNVIIVLDEEKSFMRANSDTEQVDTPMTPEEKVKFLNNFHVPKKFQQESKRIFIMIDMKGKKVNVQQTTHAGAKNNYVI